MITLEEILQLHKNSISDFGGSFGVRDLNLLESSISRPFHYFDDVELYPSAFEKAAAILQSIVKNYPFLDGNKRTGFLAAFTVLYRSGIILTSSEKDTYNFVIDVASSQISLYEISSWFSKNSESVI